MKNFIRETFFTPSLTWYNTITYITAYSIYTNFGVALAIGALLAMVAIGVAIDVNL